MTRRSSIFSFSTLRGRWRLPAATLLAVALLVGAEALARHAVARRKIFIDPTARDLIAKHRGLVSQRRAGVWLLGNSTLGYGVDADLLERQAGVTIAKLPHGSATLPATAQLLAYYLRAAAAPPRQVVIFVSKDDLNRKGYRAEVSSEYAQLCGDPWRMPQEHLMLWRARGAILRRMQAFAARLLPGGRRNAATNAPETPCFSGVIRDDDEMYLRLIHDFELDTSGIGQIAAVARHGGVAEVSVVLMPCTDAYAAFHDRHVPAEPYAKIRQALAAACLAVHARFFDFGDPSTRYGDFDDGYHLNAVGAAHFTPMLVERRVLIGPG